MHACACMHDVITILSCNQKSRNTHLFWDNCYHSEYERKQYLKSVEMDFYPNESHKCMSELCILDEL